MGNVIPFKPAKDRKDRIETSNAFNDLVEKAEFPQVYDAKDNYKKASKYVIDVIIENSVSYSIPFLSLAEHKAKDCLKRFETEDFEFYLHGIVIPEFLRSLATAEDWLRKKVTLEEIEKISIGTTKISNTDITWPCSKDKIQMYLTILERTEREIQ